MLFCWMLWSLLAFMAPISSALVTGLMPRIMSGLHSAGPLSTIAYALELAIWQFTDLPPWQLFFQPDNVPTMNQAEMLCIPSYAAIAPDHGMMVLSLHGSVRRPADVPTSFVDDMVNLFLIEASITKEHGWRSHFQALSTTGYDDLARRRMHHMVLQKPFAANVTANIPYGSPGTISFETDGAGDFRVMVQVNTTAASSDPDLTKQPVCHTGITHIPIKLAFTNDPTKAHTVLADTYLVPPYGLTISTDVDDILRIAEVWNWKQALLWVLARPFTPWRNMPEILQSWTLDNTTHFHYATDSITLNAPYYIEGIRQYYPHGSFDFRPFSLDPIRIAFEISYVFKSEEEHKKAEDELIASGVMHRGTPYDEVMHPRYHNTKRLLKAFPKRNFILMGDTTPGSVTDAFSRLALEFPDQVACVLIRDTHATEPADWMASDTWRFLKLPSNKYYFFATPDDLKQIPIDHIRDIADGKATGCFPSNMTRPVNSLKPNRIRGKAFFAIFRGLWYRIRCGLHRKSCPFEHTHFKLPSDHTPRAEHDEL